MLNKLTALLILLIPIFSLLIPFSTSLISCSLTNFPYFFGGISDATSFSTMDISSDGTIFAGGYTMDYNLLNQLTSLAPIIVQFDSFGVVQSSKAVISNPATSDLTSLKLWSQNNVNYMGGVLFDDQQNILIFFVMDQSYQFISAKHCDISNTTPYSITNDNMIFDSSLRMYIALQANSQWTVMAYEVNTQGMTISLQSSGLIMGQATAIIFGESQQVLYVGGTISQTTPTTQALTLSRVWTPNQFNGNKMTVSWTYSLSSTLIDIVQKIYLDSSHSSLYSCSSHVDGIYTGLIFTQLSLGWFIDYFVQSSKSYVTQEMTPHYRCQGLFGQSGTLTVLIFDYVSLNIFLVSVSHNEFNTLGSNE